MFMFMHGGGIGSFFIVMFIIYVLVKLSARAGGYTRNQNQYRRNRRYGLRGGMFGPNFWGGSYGPRDNFNNPYDPDNLNNPNPGNGYGPAGTPPTNSYNPYVAPNGSNPGPGFYQPNTPPASSYGWPQPTENVAASTTTTQPSATNSVRAWEMPDNQAVLKEAYVWAHSMAGWNYAGKLIVDGGMSKDEVTRYAQGKFGIAANDLVSIEAANYDDARRTFESYHLH